jgi:hypothetical protein
MMPIMPTIPIMMPIRIPIMMPIMPLMMPLVSDASVINIMMPIKPSVHDSYACDAYNA